MAEQLGLALGNQEMIAIAFAIENEKHMHHLLQEYTLGMATRAILYKKPV